MAVRGALRPAGPFGLFRGAIRASAPQQLGVHKIEEISLLDKMNQTQRSMPEMRILHLMRHVRSTDGGPTRALIDHVAVMTARGHSVGVLSADFEDSGLDSSNLIPLDVASETWGLLRRTCRDSVRRNIASADIVHLHLPWDPLNIQVARMAREAGVPYCVSLRGTLDDWCMRQKSVKKRLYMALFARSLLEQASFVHCTAAEEMRQSQVWYPRGRSVVIPNLLDLAPFRRLSGPELARRHFKLAADVPVILFLSRIHEKKGLHHLLRALPILGARHPVARVLIAGDGDISYVRSMRELASTAPKGYRVEFVGHVSGDLKLSLLEAADCFVLPSSQENFGFALFEAALTGTPIVVTNLVDTWRELESGASATIVRQDPRSIATGITTSLERTAGTARDRHAASSKKWATSYLDTSSIAAQFEAAYRGAITAP